MKEAKSCMNNYKQGGKQEKGWKRLQKIAKIAKTHHKKLSVNHWLHCKRSVANRVKLFGLQVTHYNA